MDLTRARTILAELDGAQLDAIDAEVADLVDELGIDASDPAQLDEWAARVMRDREKDSAGELMATRMAARLRVMAERRRGQTG